MIISKRKRINQIETKKTINCHFAHDSKFNRIENYVKSLELKSNCILIKNDKET